MKKIASLLLGVVIFALALVLNATGLLSGASDPAPSPAESAVQASTGSSGGSGGGPAAPAAPPAQGGAASYEKASSTSSAYTQKDDAATGSGRHADGPAPSSPPALSADGAVDVAEGGAYISKDEVAAYIHEFGHLPSNFISKTKARNAGWVSSEGNLDDVLPGMSIGGSVFYDDEDQLPDAPGRTWKECDINYTGGYRGGERIVFSNDGLIYYTGDHYKTFERLY